MSCAHRLDSLEPAISSASAHDILATPAPDRVTDSGHVVGRVVGLWRYPVKSMAAEPLAEIDVSWHGFAGDRRWAFIQGDQERSGFPWLTIRERNDMASYEPFFVEPAQPDESVTMVRTPSGEVFDVVDPALATELGNGARVIKNNRGLFDALPLSIITTQTLAWLSASTGTDLNVLRFRPNFLIESRSDEPFLEESWVGSGLRIGAAHLRVDRRDKRCVVVNVDPATSARDPAVLRELARARERCVGVYGSTGQPGWVAVGDEVTIGDRWWAAQGPSNQSR